jgi:plastocyanin
MLSRLVRSFATLALLAWCGFANADVSGTVEGVVPIEPMKGSNQVPSYHVRTKNPVMPAEDPRAVVYLERPDGHYPKSAAHEVDIAQQGYQFRPAIAAVQVGSSVTFPNRDDEFHSVFSYSRPKRFDLGRFRKDEASPPITFDEPGIVKVYCEIHKHMRALLVVVDTPWYTTTDTQGRFAVTNVPPGRYRLTAFLPSEKTLQSDVTVEGGTVEVRLAP